MKYKIILISMLLVACNSGTGEPPAGVDSSAVENRIEETSGDSPVSHEPAKTTKQNSFTNQRFRDVTISKIDTGKYDIRGKAQMFEADFGWAVNRDGKEIQSGYGLTDAGAPAWGNFQLTIVLEEKDLSAPSTLILFESSAKDGSRQHQLEIELN
jgi:hypothetical protein